MQQTPKQKVATEMFDFEYFVRGQEPPVVPVVTSSPPDPRPTSPVPSTQAPAQAPVLTKKAPPPKPPKDVVLTPEPDLDDDDDDSDLNLRPPTRTLQKPAARPLTIVSSPPVRAPTLDEVANLTAQFNRLSRANLQDQMMDIPSNPPPSAPPARALPARSSISPTPVHPAHPGDFVPEPLKLKSGAGKVVFERSD